MRLGPNSEEDGVAGCWGFGRKCKKLPTNASVCNRFLFRKVHTTTRPKPRATPSLVIVFLGGSCQPPRGLNGVPPYLASAHTRGNYNVDARSHLHGVLWGKSSISRHNLQLFFRINPWYEVVTGFGKRPATEPDEIPIFSLPRSQVAGHHQT